MKTIDPWSGVQMAFGVVLILLGVLIIIMPKLLAYFVASAVIMSGVSLLGAGLRRRKYAAGDTQQVHVDYVDL